MEVVRIQVMCIIATEDISVLDITSNRHTLYMVYIHNTNCSFKACSMLKFNMVWLQAHNRVFLFSFGPASLYF